MAKKKPFGFVGILPKGNLLDAPVKKTVHEILRVSPNEPNAMGLFIFCLPMNECISLPVFATSWIAHLPKTLEFYGSVDPDDASQYLLSFNQDVTCVSDGRGDRETCFLLFDDSETTIRVNGIEYLATARKTEAEALHWIETKTIEFFTDPGQEPS